MTIFRRGRMTPPASIGGDFDMQALARLHFHSLDQSQKTAAIRGVAATGYSDHGIASVTRLSVEQIRTLLSDGDCQ
jgi:hypothetical protein